MLLLFLPSLVAQENLWNKHQFFYLPVALSVTKPTVSNTEENSLARPWAFVSLHLFSDTSAFCLNNY